MTAQLFSKTNYTNGSQCPKMLWMARNMPEWREVDAKQQGLLDGGEQVGALARAWCGEHVLIEQDYDYTRMSADTASALALGKTVCEATFTDGEGVCMVDICKPNADGSISLFEVKATTKVKPYHILDLAYQVWLCEKCGYAVSDASIVHLDGDYRLSGAVDVDGLFVVEDVTEKVRDEVLSVSGEVKRFCEVRDQYAEPETEIGRHCNSPHPCPFQKWCWRDVPEDSVFSLAGMGRVRGFKLWDEGIKTQSDALKHNVDGGKVKLNGLQAAQAEGAAHINGKRISDFLQNIHYPLYFLDFETIQPAVPVFEGTKVYQQVPTQYSLHWIDEPCGELHHAEYLAPSTGDPRRGVAESLVNDIPRGACVTAYNMSFEKGRIRELAETYPDLFDSLMGIHDSIVDLMVPFRSGYVYLPAMAGSYSIKKVLPALYPDDSELDYSKLDGVHNGGEAILAFMTLAELDPEEERRVREQLLRYCELDTFAMVKVWEWLELHRA